MIEVRVFAALREQVGSDSLQLPLPYEGITVAAFIDALDEQQAPTLVAALRALPRRMVAINEVLVQEQAALHSGDVLALFPPVTGG